MYLTFNQSCHSPVLYGPSAGACVMLLVGRYVHRIRVCLRLVHLDIVALAATSFSFLFLFIRVCATLVRGHRGGIL
jgi:hypothetical protein